MFSSAIGSDGGFEFMALAIKFMRESHTTWQKICRFLSSHRLSYQTRCIRDKIGLYYLLLLWRKKQSIWSLIIGDNPKIYEHCPPRYYHTDLYDHVWASNYDPKSVFIFFWCLNMLLYAKYDLTIVVAQRCNQCTEFILISFYEAQ